MNKPSSIQDTLHHLHLLVKAAHRDVDKFLQSPEAFSAEYFEDVRVALAEAQDLAAHAKRLTTPTK